MCLHAESGIQIATKDMVVYKFGTFLPNGGFTPWQIYNYKLYKNQPYVKLKTNNGAVDEGYHSWKRDTLLMGDTRNAIFVIPKGTEYIYGEQYDNTEGYVSSNIVFIGKNTFFFRWGIRLGIIKVKNLIEKLPEKKKVLEKSTTFGDY